LVGEEDDLIGESGRSKGEGAGPAGWTGTSAGRGTSSNDALVGEAERGGHAAALALTGDGGREPPLGICGSGGRAALLGDNGDAAASLVGLRGAARSLMPARRSRSPSSSSEGAMGDLSRSNWRRATPVLPLLPPPLDAEPIVPEMPSPLDDALTCGDGLALHGPPGLCGGVFEPPEGSDGRPHLLGAGGTETGCLAKALCGGWGEGGMMRVRVEALSKQRSQEGRPARSMTASVDGSCS